MHLIADAAKRAMMDYLVMNELLRKTLEDFSQVEISSERKEVLKPLIEYVQGKVDNKEEVRLNFICTHNSRRSQLAQVWAQVSSIFFGLDTRCFSGGVEVTAFNERAVRSLIKSGFVVDHTEGSNPEYRLNYGGEHPIIAFSKEYDHPHNQGGKYAAVMTCTHADENCPHIPDAEQRISVRYEDPKAYDDTPDEVMAYDSRSAQIGSEMFYVFSQISRNE
ncbi:low molecular weight phosphatase family protein [Echinicola pacifica]|uniref:protein-tyrosine-phosphatase n=1 Tax=Echinicola pacifica TaxID=346377 RepID=UPI001F0B6BC1|nr:protein-tyrosine-phosphatase [Echinicola pacifica]